MIKQVFVVEGIGMGLDIIEVEPGDDMLKTLMGRALADDARDRFVITPASLRPYAERRVLLGLRDAVRTPGRTVAVHSFASFASSVVGNRDLGAYAKAALSDFSLRTFVRRCMREDSTLFGGALATSGFVALAAKQLRELVCDGVEAGVLERDGRESGSSRMISLARLLRLYADRYDPDRALTGDVAAVIVPWSERHAADCRWYLYGFGDLSGSELRAVAAVMARGNVTVVCRSGEEPGYCSVLRGGDPAASDRRPIVEAPQGRAWIASFPNVVDELRWVRDRIAADLKESVSPRDILVTARDLTPYSRFLCGEFAKAGIAVNGVDDATMADHALANMLLGLMDPALYEFDVASIIRVFGSGMLSTGAEWRPDVFRDLRNHLVTHVVGRDDWLSDSPMPDCRPDIALPVDGLRRAIRDTVLGADAVFGLASAACDRSVREAVEEMVGFLLAHCVGVTDDGSKRVWGKVMSLFDELVDVACDDPFRWHAATLAKDIGSALHSSRIAPANAINAVDVASYDHVPHPYGRVYCLGACGDAMPAVAHETDMLGDVERQRLSHALDGSDPIAAYALTARTISGKSRLEPEMFNALVAAARDRIVFTYPRNLHGVDQVPSDYVLETKAAAWPDDGMKRPPDDYAPVTVGSDSIAPERAVRLFTAANGEQRVMLVSVSALETFFRNPMDYFAKYGLRLDPLQPAQLDVAVQGTYLHAVLERTVKALIGLYGDRLRMPATTGANGDTGEGRPSLDEVRALVSRYADLHYRPDPVRDAGDANCPETTLLEENPQFAVLDEDDRMRMIRGKLERRVLSAVEAYARLRGDMLRQLRWDGVQSPDRSGDVSGDGFRPLAAERTFGTGDRGSMPALDYGVLRSPDGDVTLQVQGKVDRVDELLLDGHAGTVVIDYKSNGKTLFPGRKGGPESKDATTSFYGRELQLMTYASAIVDTAGSQLPPVVAAFFLPVSKPEYAKVSLNDGSDVATAFLTGGNGNDAAGAASADPIDPTGSGVLVAPLSEAAPGDGEPVGYVALTGREFDALRAYARNAIREGCARLLNGEVGAHPSRTRDGASYRDGDQYSLYRDLTALERLSDDYWDFQPKKTLEDLLDAAKEEH